MRYILYARKSSENEDRQVQSIDDQLRVLRALAEQRSLQVIEELVESRSAKAPGTRPVFTALLERIEAREADAILCWSINRLSRNPVDSGTLSWMLQQGLLQQILTIDREYRPDDNVLLMAVETGTANQYILDLRKNVARGTQTKLLKGWFPHGAPQGYINNTVDKTIEPDGDRFQLLRRAWDLMLTGAYTVPQVRDELTRWGYRTRKTKRLGGNPIPRSAIYRVFENPFYYGAFLHGGKLFEGSHQPMVTKHEFDRVQRLLHKEHHIQPQKKEFAFTGLMLCGLCGCLITAEEKVKQYKARSVRYVYYHCTGSTGCRPKTSISESEIERRIEELLEWVRIDEDTEDWIESVLVREAEEQPDSIHSLAIRQIQALAHTRRKLDRLFDMREDEEISKHEFTQRKQRFEAEIAQMESERDEAQERYHRSIESVRNAAHFAATAYERFTHGGVRARREVAQLLSTNYLLTLGKLEITPHPLLDRIRTFEPPEIGSGKEKEGPFCPSSPYWLRYRDDISNLLNLELPEFPTLPGIKM